MHFRRKRRGTTGQHTGLRIHWVQHRFPCTELMGRQHGLGMLLFVLDHHAESEPALQQRRTFQWDPVQDVQRLGADLSEVAAGFRGSQQRQ